MTMASNGAASSGTSFRGGSRSR